MLNRPRYYASTRTVLMVRLDPGTTDGYLPGEVRDERQPGPRNKPPSRRRLDALQSVSSPRSAERESFRALITNAREDLASVNALVRRTDQLTIVADLQPQSSSRKVNSYRKADELDLTFSWQAAPFDARLVRAMLVLHYEGTTDPRSFASGRRDAPAHTGQGGGFLVPRIGRNLRYIGLVDEIEDAHGADGDKLTLKSRDLTALLIDTKWPPMLEVKIPAGSTIADTVRAILDKNPAFDLLRGPFIRVDGELPKLSPKLYPRLAVAARERHRTGAVGPAYTLRQPPKQGGDSSFWDVITDLCVSHGLRPYVEKDAIVLVEPRVLYSQREPDVIGQFGIPTFPTPYRVAIDDVDVRMRRMVYGVNIETLRFHRKLSREKRPTIEVSSRNPDAPPNQRLIAVRWPPRHALSERATTQDKQLQAYRAAVEKEVGRFPLVAAGTISQVAKDAKGHGQNANSVAATGQDAEDKVKVIQLRGIVDKAALTHVAQQIYEAIGRGEFGLSISTNELASFSDHPSFDPNRDPDLLDLRHGDPIQVLVASSMDRSRIYTLSEFQRFVDKARANVVSAGESRAWTNAVTYLVDQGWNREVADNFVRALTSANLPDVFRVIGATIAFDAESGFSVSLEASDYVRVRADSGAPLKRKPKVVPAATFGPFSPHDPFAE